MHTVCTIHHMPLVCPACLGTTGGKSTSEAKRAAARKNGKKGGRPKRTTTLAQTKTGRYVWLPEGFDLHADYASPRTYKGEYAISETGGHSGQYCRVRVDHDATGTGTPGTGDIVVSAI